MFSAKIVLILLKLTALFFKVQKPDKAKVKIPPQFAVFKGYPPNSVAWSVAEAYCQIFGQPPWSEKHTAPSVLNKLERELKSASSLVVMRGDIAEAEPVGGFSWGSVINPEEIPQRVVLARFQHEPQRVAEIRPMIKHLNNPTILFLDELAVLPQFRKGLAPVQFLLRPLLELGYEHGARKAMFWTSKASPIYRLARYVGFYPIHTVNNIVFMYNPDFWPLLKVAQNLDPKTASRVLALTSLFVRKKP